MATKSSDIPNKDESDGQNSDSANYDNGKAKAADLIRRKLENIYSGEPNAEDELGELDDLGNKKQSKHQLFLEQLSSSGKGLAEIQTEWHNYYIGLPDKEKHEVWQEFYSASGTSSQYFHKVSKQIQETRTAQKKPENTTVIVAEHSHALPVKKDHRQVKDSKKKAARRVKSRGKLTAKHHLQSLFFGLGVGLFVVIIFMFGFFNEVIIAPFIQPSRTVSSTPIILNSNAILPNTPNEVIIPKINVEIPVDYSEASTDEAVIENDLEDGAVHYPTTVLPGQVGNTVYFGHSSNNIFNPGKYKFAFVLLHTLVDGDTFYLVYNHVVYAYQVFNTQIVSPNDVSVLGSVAGKQATATLITCDPPGTSINRLVVYGEQISPNPNTNAGAPPMTYSSANAPKTLPGNGPTLWSRFTHWLF